MTVVITVEGQAPKFLTAPTYTLGRAVECDVRLPEGDRLVSREHARLERDEEGGWWLADLSTNGTFVNGERVSGRRALRVGDQISIGRSQIAFSSLAPSPEPVDQASARTISISATELRAGIKEVASRSPAQQAASRAPASPAAPLPSSLASAPAFPVATAAPEAVATPAASELGTVGAGSNGTQVLPQAVPSGAATVASGAEDGSANEAGPMKQCTGCGRLYAPEQNDCPQCAGSGFRIKGTAPATALVTSQVAAPTSNPAPVSAAPQLPTADATPFDRVEQASQPARPAPNGVAPLVAPATTPIGAAAPVAPAAPLDGVASPVAPGAPKPFVPPTLADWPEVDLADVTFGLPREPSPRPGLSWAGLGCGSVMLLSLFLPWAAWGLNSISYAQVCRTALAGAARAGSSGQDLYRFGSASRAGASDPRLLLPALATAVALGSTVSMLGSRRSRTRGSASSLALACGGTLGLVGAGTLHASLPGLGHWAFAAASAGAVVAGLAGLATLRPARSR